MSTKPKKEKPKYSNAGKGDKNRVSDVNKYAENWEKIFGKKGVDDLLDAYSKVLDKHLPDAEKKEKKKDA